MKLINMSSLKLMLPVLGIAVGLYPVVIHSVYWLVFTFIIGLLLYQGVRAGEFLYFQLTAVIFGLAYFILITTVEETGTEYFYGVLIGITIYIVLELGYIFSIVNKKFLSEDKDYQSINTKLLYPIIKRFLGVGLITILVSVLVVGISVTVNVVVISPVIDLFILITLLASILYSIYRALSYQL
ncbi:hypothetical protein [Natranaerobius thermophilus]|uniref:Uncharacterized protein n=1 Tax=Natranaerobius thermophilus (strain ATCC BAA-1301 / DSM 18059 / JW/NM-WN-LF) TaxID=457570 RepID=B2A7G2_NATTJ|nr:hypothetical protein [Natranaerobius thermophilus]ACB85671.1 hypothetical protein Nther_2104 [Natranaerobius thermophilus JW/NM-WN-LF]